MEYTIDYMIDRAYNKLEEIHNESQLENIKLTKPITTRLNRKTKITNFRIICSNLNRDENHLLKHFHEEISPDISISGKGSLVLTGTHRDNNINNVMISYIKKYVKCSECSSYNTQLTKENGLVFIKCEKCDSKKSII